MKYEENYDDVKIFEKEYRDQLGDDFRKLMARLSKIEGQVRGLKKMLEDDRTCEDIVLQVSAAQAALGSFNRELITQYIRDCAARDIKKGGDDAIVALSAMIHRIIKDNSIDFSKIGADSIVYEEAEPEEIDEEEIAIKKLKDEGGRF